MPRTCPTCQIEWADDVETCPDDGTALPEDDPLLGRTVGSYKVLRRLGKGGMGAVYLAEHPVIGSKVAIKFLHAQFSKDKRVVDRFFNEARAVNLIGHDNILKILDLNATEDGHHYFVMEFLEGRSLQGLVESRQKAIGEKWVPLEEAGPILLQCCEALQAAHDKGIIHRDLKPDNVFLVKLNGRLNVVKVVDFGIARLTDASGASAGRTQTGMVMGTPAYMSPEQASGATRQIDPRSDVYSMGVMAFQMCCGRLPFTGKSFGELLAQHLQKEPPRPRSLNPGLPEAVEEVILTALRKQQDERFQTMVEMADALRDALQQNGFPIEPPVDPESDSRSGKNRPPTVRKPGGKPKRPANSTLVDDEDDVAGATVPIQAPLRRGPARPGSQPQAASAAAPSARARPVPRSRRSAFEGGTGETVPPDAPGEDDEDSQPTIAHQEQQDEPPPGDEAPGAGERPLTLSDTAPGEGTIPVAYGEGGAVERPASGRSRPSSRRAAAPGQARAAPTEGRRSRAPLLLGIAAAVVLGVGAFWLLRGGGGETKAQAPGKPGTAAAAPAPPAPPATPEGPVTFPIAVASEPAGASVLATWEGGSGGGVAPFTLDAPRGVTVELRFSLDGYFPKTQRVVADGPRQASVQLRPVPPPAPEQAEPAPPPAPESARPPPKRRPKEKDKASRDELINPF